MEEEKKEQEEKVEVVEAEEVKEEEKEEKSAFEKLNDTKDSTKDFDAKDIEDNKAFAILAYIGILVLIPLLAAPKSKFARYHTNQGLVLFICELIAGFVHGILHFMFTVVVDVHIVDVILSIIFDILYLAYIILIIIGVANVCQDKAKELPIIGKFKILNENSEDKK